MLESLRIAFVGSGAMGEAMIKGLLARRVTPEHITASDPVAGGANRFMPTSACARPTTSAAVRTADVAVLCVKPQVAGKVMAALHGLLQPSALALSIMAAACRLRR